MKSPSNKSTKTVITVLLSIAAVLLIAAIAALAVNYGLSSSKSPSVETAQEQTISKGQEPETQSVKLAESSSIPETETYVSTNSMESETESESSSKDNDGPLIVVDAGHQGPGLDMSGEEPVAPGSSTMKAKVVTGTYGRTTNLNEYELVLQVSLTLQKELESRGYRVLMTRTDHDTLLSNVERARIANENHADAMVRVHANGSDDSSIGGALTMSPSPDNPYVTSYEDCMRLSQNIIDSYCAATGLENDGILYEDSMTGINWCQVPVTILELGFMTNPGDDTYMADTNNHPAMAKGIADGIDKYFSR